MVSAQQVWAVLEPRDAVQVRDGRAFEAGGAARTRRPWPSTIAGAIGAAWGGDGQLAAVRGPILARRDTTTGSWTPGFTVPADVVPTEGPGRVWRRLRPEPSGAITDLDEEGLLWLNAPDAGAFDEHAWWDARAMGAYLRGAELNLRRAVRTSSPVAVEHRVGIARQDRRVRDAHLYSSDFLRLRENASEQWAFAAQCSLLPGQRIPERLGPVRLGGESRLADVRVVQGLDFPPPPEVLPGGRVLVYLVTPGVWRRRGSDGEWRNTWRPSIPANARLVAAAVPSPVPVATARPDGRGGLEQARLRWAVPAGSVYLLEFTGPDPETAALAWASERHGRAWGDGEDNEDRIGRRLATAGFGLMLTGTWS